MRVVPVLTLALGALNLVPERDGPPEPSALSESADAVLDSIFAAESAVGTMVIRRLSDGREWVHNPARADSAFLPASTFKIANAAIALETGVASGPEEAFPWDGVEREIEAWNQDHTLRTAMAASAVPVYQVVARRIGEERMSEWLRRIDYGNADIGGGIDRFWLIGDLRTTAWQQVDFLTRFATGETPFSAGTEASVADMLVNGSGEDWVLYGKTGWAFEVELGWWVGWTEYRGETYLFALNLDMPAGATDAPKRVSIGRAALVAVGALPEDPDSSR